MRRMLVVLALTALAAASALVPASGHVRDADGCPYHIDETSADKPNLVDPTGDWSGPVLGNGEASLGDVYREGTDLTKAWMVRDNLTGNVQAVIEVVSLLEAQPNSIFYMLWTYPEGDPEARRWVAARLKVGSSAFTYGYLGAGTTGQTFITQGETTGQVLPGTPGRIVVDVPMDKLGSPGFGADLFDLTAEARVLVGSPEPLPQPPSPLRHGFVFVADTTLNATEFCDVYVNDPAEPGP